MLYVDDGLVAGTNENDLKDLLKELKAEFKMTAKEANYFFGIGDKEKK